MSPAKIRKIRQRLRARAARLLEDTRIDGRRRLFHWCSSLAVHYLARCHGHRPWVRRRCLTVRYADGLILYFPLVDAYYLPWMIERMSDRYQEGFANLLGHPVELAAGDVVIDAGANVGRFSIPLGLATPARILAFEPDPAGFRCLARGVAANRLGGHLTAVQAAVHGRTERLLFVPGDHSTVGTIASSSGIPVPGRAAGVEVDALGLDEVFKRYGIERCKLLKIDTEGSEHAILTQASDRTLDRIDHLVAEVHPQPDADPEAWLARLRKRGRVETRGAADGPHEIFFTQDPQGATP